MKKHSTLQSITMILRHGLFAIVVALSVSTLHAQDRIILKNGNTLETKVLEIQLTEIKYKRFDNPNGPVYSLLKSDVFLIMYENGTKEVIGELPSAPAASAPPAVQPAPATRETKKQTPAAAPKQNQSSNQLELKTHKNLVMGGIALPLHDDYGLELGYFGLYELTTPVSKIIGVTSHVSMSYNKFTTYGYYDDYDSGEFNSRIMAGLAFNTPAKKKGGASIYGMALIGSNYEFYKDGQYDSKFSFAYGAGAGVRFGNIVDIGSRFFHRTAEYATPLLLIGLGFHF